MFSPPCWQTPEPSSNFQLSQANTPPGVLNNAIRLSRWANDLAPPSVMSSIAAARTQLLTAASVACGEYLRGDYFFKRTLSQAAGGSRDLKRDLAQCGTPTADAGAHAAGRDRRQYSEV